MIKPFITILLIFSLLSTASASPFDTTAFRANCDLNLNPNADPIAQTIAKFSGSEVNFEESLGWIATLLTDEDEGQTDFTEKKKFIFEIIEQLAEDPSQPVEVVRSREMLWLKSKRPKKHVEYWTQAFDLDPSQVLHWLFDTIRTAYSSEIGDAHQYNNSVKEERVYFSEQFLNGATRVLFFQYKLYRKLLKLSKLGDREVKNGPLLLTREHKLPIPHRKDMRFWGPSSRKTLFELVELRLTLFRHLDNISLQSDVALEKEINSYVLNHFINLMPIYFSAKGGLLKRTGYSLVVLVAAGLLVAVTPLRGWVDDFPGVQKIKQALGYDFEQNNVLEIEVDPALVIKQIENDERKAPLTEAQKILLRELKNKPSTND